MKSILTALDQNLRYKTHFEARYSLDESHDLPFVSKKLY